MLIKHNLEGIRLELSQRLQDAEEGRLSAYFNVDEMKCLVKAITKVLAFMDARFPTPEVVCF